MPEFIDKSELLHIIDNKIDKVSPATAGNLVIQKSDGTLENVTGGIIEGYKRYTISSTTNINTTLVTIFSYTITETTLYRIQGNLLFDNGQNLSGTSNISLRIYENTTLLYASEASIYANGGIARYAHIDFTDIQQLTSGKTLYVKVNASLNTVIRLIHGIYGASHFIIEKLYNVGAL